MYRLEQFLFWVIRFGGDKHLADAEFERVFQKVAEHIQRNAFGQFDGDVFVGGLHRASCRVHVRKSVLHHVQKCTLVAEALLREKLRKVSGLVQRNLVLGPRFGKPDFLCGRDVLIAINSIDQKLSDVIYDGGRVKFGILADVLIHVAHVETFACAHELAKERVTALGNRRIVARPRAARLAEV